MDPEQSLRVLVNDADGELLGEDPERLAADDASMERCQALVEGLLCSGENRDLGHRLIVAQARGTGASVSGLVLSASKASWVRSTPVAGPPG